MRLLALDTATEACSVAVLTEHRVFGAFEEVGRGHAERILVMVDTVLEQAGLALAKLDGVVASVGPGAFTGVRISVSVAQGLAFGASVPVVGVSTLEALACQAMRGGADQVLACLDARMGEVYWGCYRAGADGLPVACGAPAVGAATTIELPFTGAVHGIGRGFAAYPALAALRGIRLPPGAERSLPDARDMVRLGAKRLEAGEGMDPAQLTPLYVRDKVALTESERAAAKGGPR
jgi:tRNA threonylcarbamoyladenosine biosynthesis protein TsaB